MPRPSQPKLSLDRIAAAALTEVDATGDFTMPGIAARLKVRPSSLYNHVRGRDEIVELLREHAMAAVVVPVPVDDPLAVVATIAREYRAAYARHPRLIPLLTAQTVRAPAAFAMYNVLAQAFSDTGLGPADVLAAITALDSFVLGGSKGCARTDGERHRGRGRDL